MLGSGSAYFNSLFRSQMMRNKSTEQVVIDDCTPEEWQLISHFFKPAHLNGASMADITLSNVEMLIPCLMNLWLICCYQGVTKFIVYK
jgi:hypothetical protein